MSALIEKVARAAHDAQWEDGFDRLPPNGIERALAEQVSRAAIAAVAEWMIDEFSYQAEMIEIKQAMVAALRAAAGEGK